MCQPFKVTVSIQVERLLPEPIAAYINALVMVHERNEMESKLLQRVCACFVRAHHSEALAPGFS